MTTQTTGGLERDWARVGVLFGCAPSRRTPDLERLILDTARNCPDNFRLFILSVSWLAQFSHFVAHHRLKRLVRDELDAESRAVLGLIIEEAVAMGATRDLLVAIDACEPRTDAIPLALVQRDSPTLAALALAHASERSKRWGVWAPPVAPKTSAIRPVGWILARNPEYRDRIIRKGDLRVSILETLRRDVDDGVAPSESALTRLSGATRTAVRKALHALELEGEVTVGAVPGNDRDHAVRLVEAA